MSFDVAYPTSRSANNDQWLVIAKHFCFIISHLSVKLPVNLSDIVYESLLFKATFELSIWHSYTENFFRNIALF